MSIFEKVLVSPGGGDAPNYLTVHRYFGSGSNSIFDPPATESVTPWIKPLNALTDRVEVIEAWISTHEDGDHSDGSSGEAVDYSDDFSALQEEDSDLHARIDDLEDQVEALSDLIGDLQLQIDDLSNGSEGGSGGTDEPVDPPSEDNETPWTYGRIDAVNWWDSDGQHSRLTADFAVHEGNGLSVEVAQSIADKFLSAISPFTTSENPAISIYAADQFGRESDPCDGMTRVEFEIGRVEGDDGFTDYVDDFINPGFTEVDLEFTYTDEAGYNFR